MPVIEGEPDLGQCQKPDISPTIVIQFPPKKYINLLAVGIRRLHMWPWFSEWSVDKHFATEFNKNVWEFMNLKGLWLIGLADFEYS